MVASIVEMLTRTSPDDAFPMECKDQEECNYPCREDDGSDVNFASLSLPEIPYDLLLRTLRREETLRLCPELQALYDEFEHPPGDIESELQRSCLRESGLCRCWLHAYWSTSYRFPLAETTTGTITSETKAKTDAVRNTTVWLRHYERFIEDDEVPIRVGDYVPDVPLLLLSIGGCEGKSGTALTGTSTTTTITSLHHFVRHTDTHRKGKGKGRGRGTGKPLVVVAGSGS